MPTYDYKCKKTGCEKNYSVIKSIKEYDGRDLCPSCSSEGDRIFSSKVMFLGTKIEDAEFNVGLGVVTKSKRHRDEIARSRGLVEIGNEKPETIHKSMDAARAERNKKRWSDT